MRWFSMPSRRSAARPAEEGGLKGMRLEGQLSVSGGSSLRGVENAVVRLLKARPFYGHLLLHFRRRLCASGPAIGATIENGTPTLVFNPAAFAEVPPPGQVALLEHVLKHVLHLHMARRKERHSDDWDLACDLAINPGIADLPPQALLPERLRLPEGLSAEEYYLLIHRPFDTGNQRGSGVGNASRDSGVHVDRGGDRGDRDAAATIDDHRIWREADSTPGALVEEVVRSLVREAYRQSRGEVPGELRSLVDGWLAPSPVPWAQVLRQFVAAAGRVGRRSTWKREHRRFAHQTPGVSKRRRLNLLIGVDVSDSTSEQGVREAFARELLAIASGRDCALTVLYSGSRIQRIDTFRGSPLVAEAYHGGGFTDLRPVFDYARTMQPRPAAVIYLTDGFGEAPESMELPTLWVLTATGEKPVDWGVELRLGGTMSAKTRED